MLELRKLDLNTLVIFDAVHRARSVTGAASRLGLTQPTVSFALSKLRRQFQDALFVRSPHGMVPTPLADELAPAVHEVLEVVRRRIVEREVVDPSTLDRTLRLCTTDGHGLAVLPRIIRHWLAAAPRWKVDTVTLGPAQLAEALRSGDVDLALGNFWHLAGGFYRQRLIPIGYQVLYRSDHPQFQGPLSLEEYLSARHAVVRVPGRASSVVAEMLAARGFERDVVMTIPHFVLLPMVVAQTDLIATVPGPVADYFSEHHGLAACPLPLDVPQLMIAQYWHERFNDDPINRWIRRTLVGLFRDDAQQAREEALAGQR